MGEKGAAIDPDGLLDRSLKDISAAELISALNHPSAKTDLTHITDKKKVELWVDEGPIFELSLGEILARIRADKKKVELELPPGIDWRVLPEASRKQLVEEVAQTVQQRLGR